MREKVRKSFLVVLVLANFFTAEVFARPYPLPPKHQTALADMFLQLWNITVDKVKVIPISGGYSGDTLYLLHYGPTKIVLRIHSDKKSLSDQKLEQHATQNAFKLGIGPRVLYTSKDHRLLATKFVPLNHPTPNSFTQNTLIKNFAKSLLTLHNGPKLSRPWSVFNYIKRLLPKTLSSQEKLALKELLKIEQLIDNAHFPQKSCHNDLQPSNLFVSKDKVSFIDWGDAGMSDPYWDLARVSMEFSFTPKQDQVFLETYLKDVSPLAKSRFFLMKQVFLLRSALWLKTLEGGPTQEKLRQILKIFQVNNFLFTPGKEQTSWQEISAHALKLFLKNTQTNLYRKSLKLIAGA